MQLSPSIAASRGCVGLSGLRGRNSSELRRLFNNLLPNVAAKRQRWALFRNRFTVEDAGFNLPFCHFIEL